MIDELKKILLSLENKIGDHAPSISTAISSLNDYEQGKTDKRTVIARLLEAGKEIIELNNSNINLDLKGDIKTLTAQIYDFKISTGRRDFIKTGLKAAVVAFGASSLGKKVFASSKIADVFLITFYSGESYNRKEYAEIIEKAPRGSFFFVTNGPQVKYGYIDKKRELITAIITYLPQPPQPYQDLKRTISICEAEGIDINNITIHMYITYEGYHWMEYDKDKIITKLEERGVPYKQIIIYVPKKNKPKNIGPVKVIAF